MICTNQAYGCPAKICCNTITVEISPSLAYNVEKYAGVAQLLERFLAKEEVES